MEDFHLWDIILKSYVRSLIDTSNFLSPSRARQKQPDRRTDRPCAKRGPDQRRIRGNQDDSQSVNG